MQWIHLIVMVLKILFFHWAVANPSINRHFGCDALRFMCQHMEKYGSLMDAFAANAKEESIFHSIHSLIRM